MDKFDIFYFSSTHWDREWYQDFQGFRYRLVKMTDALLKLLESDNDYQTFHFDGQTVVLEDYLEIRPERRAELADRIREGRILIGPWYVMPDEFLVSGESLIRNLNRGHKIAESYGVSPWKFGYVCDCFGHIAQLPQIFSMYGIKYSLLGRGTDDNAPMYSRWMAPDGTSTVNFVVPQAGGYGAFYSAYTYGHNVDTGADNPIVVENIKKYIDGELERANGVPVVVIMDGLDHMPAAPHTTQYIEKIKELYPEATVHHVDLCRALELAAKVQPDLPVIRGELNKTPKKLYPYLHLITNTLSSYYPLKRENGICENLLEKKLEPLGVMSMTSKNKLDRVYIDLAYKHLIQNHPHDSICGCSIDAVHKDMEYRFDQVKEIGAALSENFLYEDPFDNRKDDENGVIRFYNTLTYDIERTLTVDIPFPTSWKYAYYEPFAYEKINAFKVYSPSGEEVPYKVTAIKRGSSCRFYKNNADKRDVHSVTMTVSIPALGYADYRIEGVASSVRYLKKMTSGQTFAENDLVRVDINTDGTLKLTDKRNDKIYDGLCSFLDDGEIGDGWYHANPVNDLVVSSIGSPCSIEKCEDGPARVAFRITKTMSIPECIVTDNFGKTRSKNRVDIKLESTVSLSENSSYPEVSLRFVNTAEGHRLKLMLPTRIAEDKYFTSQAFCFLDRKVGIDYATQDYLEHDQYEKATGGIVGKRDKDGFGLAFVSAYGIKECSAYEGEEGMLALTLLRSFTNTVMTDGGERCKLLGVPMEYRFALMPLSPETSNLDMLKAADSIAVEPIVKYIAHNEEAKTSLGVVKVESESVAVSVVKRPENEEDGVVVIRMFNPSEKPAMAKISTPHILLSARGTDPCESGHWNEPLTENTFECILPPWKIRTYKLKLKFTE